MKQYKNFNEYNKYICMKCGKNHPYIIDCCGQVTINKFETKRCITCGYTTNSYSCPLCGSQTIGIACDGIEDLRGGQRINNEKVKEII